MREERSKGWRTRVVDHCTESGLNVACRISDHPTHDTLDVLVAIVERCISLGIDVEMFKGDVSQAFRRLPVAERHLDLAWVVWISNGTLYKARHSGLMFGPTGAVYG